MSEKVKEKKNIEGDPSNLFEPLTEQMVLERLESTRMRVEGGGDLFPAHHSSTVIREKYGIGHPWDEVLKGLEMFSEDFMKDGRGDLVVDKKEDL